MKKFDRMVDKQRADGEARLSQFEELLRSGAFTVVEIAQRLHISRSLVDYRLNGRLRECVRVASHDFNKHAAGRPAARWTWGEGADAAIPPLPRKARAPTPTVDTEAWMDRRARQIAAATRPFRDPMTSAFFGTP